MATSVPQAISTIVGANHWEYTTLKLVECRYVWVIKNASYYTNELESGVFSANRNKHNIKWQLLFRWDIKPEADYTYKAQIILKLVSTEDECVRCAWEVFVKDSKGILNRISCSDLFTAFPGDRKYQYLPYTIKEHMRSLKDVLQENMLTIVVHISMVNSTQQTGMAETETEKPYCTPITDLGKLLTDPEFSDVTIIVGNSKIPVHRNILALRSDVFAAMFRHELKEKRTNQIVIADFNSKVIKEMLRYIYTGDTSKVSQMTGELLRAADTYDLQGLKKACISELYSKLTNETAVQALVAADLHSIDQLKRQAIDFINAHSSAIVKTDAFRDLVKNYPHIVLNIFERQQSSE